VLVSGYMARQQGAGAASQLSPAGGGVGSLLGGLLGGPTAEAGGVTPGAGGGLAST